MGMGGAAAIARQASAEAPPLTRPHVLVIHTDQHRIDCLGAYGNRQVQTPHIDGLAADGVRFTESFCSYPVCTPSRYSLLSGLPVHQHRGWTNHCTLPPGVPTFASLLRDAGYATTAVGKMHFTPTYLDVGFQEMRLAEQDGPGRWDDDYHRYLRKLDLVDANDLEDQRAEYRRMARPEYWSTFGALPSNLPEEHHATTWIGDRAVDTVSRWDAAHPALLMVGFVKPHHPFDPPVEWARRYDPAAPDPLPGWTSEAPHDDSRRYFPDSKLTEDTLRRCTAYYYATISHVDHQVGRIVDALKRRGLYERALIVFTSDHGEYMGFHHLLLKAGPMFDPLAKVPLVVKLPGTRRGGRVDGRLVSTVDVAPTILRAAGVAQPAAMKGLDLAGRGHRDVVFCETHDEVMARTRTAKLIRNARTPTEDAYYRLDDDPLERRNLAADAAHRAEIERLAQAAQDWRPGPLPATYLDENAPVVAAPNVPRRGDGHAEEMAAWTMARFERWQKEGR